jgi:hypothetical protein
MDCVEGSGWTDHAGYKITYWAKRDGGDGKEWRAHRRVWVEHFGPIPDGLVICHRCDNPPCVNIDHLFLGTRADNNADRDSKGRQGVGYQAGSPGERNGAAKLSSDDVLAIRERVRLGETQISVAQSYGIRQSQVSRIINGKRWRHVIDR